MTTSSYCLRAGGRHAEPDHIVLLQDCAQMCAVAADFMLRGSDRSRRACEFCAEICLTCANDCDRFPDDQHMRVCAETCRRCMEACRELVGE